MSYFLFVIGAITALMPYLGFPYSVEKVWYVLVGLMFMGMGIWLYVDVVRLRSRMQKVFVEKEPQTADNSWGGEADEDDENGESAPDNNTPALDVSNSHKLSAEEEKEGMGN